MGAEAEVPRVRDFTVDRRGGRGEGASWEASQRRPQEDAEGMPIRHTEHCKVATHQTLSYPCFGLSPALEL